MYHAKYKFPIRTWYGYNIFLNYPCFIYTHAHNLQTHEPLSVYSQIVPFFWLLIGSFFITKGTIDFGLWYPHETMLTSVFLALGAIEICICHRLHMNMAVFPNQRMGCPVPRLTKKRRNTVIINEAERAER